MKIYGHVVDYIRPKLEPKHYLSVARSFTQYPYGVKRSDGPFSGEVFREDILLPTLDQLNIKVVVNLDGTYGYSSSWLKEAFGPLTRRFSINELRSKLEITSLEDYSLVYEVWGYIDPRE